MMQNSSLSSFRVDHLPDDMFDISCYGDENDYDYLDLDFKKRNYSAATICGSTSVKSEDASTSYSSIHSHCRNGLNRLLRRDYPIPRTSKRSYENIRSYSSKVEAEDDEAVYQNIVSFQNSEDTSHLYARLLCSVLLQVLDSFDGSRRLAKIEKSIEKVVGIDTEKRLDLLNYEEKKEHIYFFCKQVEIALRRINSSSLVTYRRVSDELCAILSSARRPQKSKFQKLTNSFKKVFYF
ncbi:unnamed protein product [Auanema sp. JU1783]|nr:unnamed protein product [Auanema sp. JU1783]